MIRYFGEKWDAPATDEAEKVDPPIGIPCIHCSENVEAEDSGIHFVNGYVVHIECWLRMGIGGINHLKGKCSCCGGDEEPDPPGLTKREAALLVKDYIEKCKKHGVELYSQEAKAL